MSNALRAFILFFAVVATALVALLSLVIVARADEDEACFTAAKLSYPVLVAQKKILDVTNRFNYAASRHLGTPSFVVDDFNQLRREIAALYLDVPKLTRQRERYLKARSNCRG